MRDRLEQTTTVCPVVRVEEGPWCRYGDLSGGAGRHGVMTFDARVEWVRETTSGVVVRYANGTRDADDQSDTHTDWYGYGSSAMDVVDIARMKASKFGAAPGTAVSVEAFTLVSDRPLLPLVRREPFSLGPRREYEVPPKDWLRPDDPWLRDRLAFDAAPTGDFLDSEHRPKAVRSMDVARVTLWSSASGEGSPEAAALLEAALAALVDGIPEGTAAELSRHWAEWVSGGCRGTA